LGDGFFGLNRGALMGRLLFLVFMIVPLIEIAFFVVIGNAIGLWPTLLGVLATAVAGSLVLKYQGQALFQEIQRTMSRGALPARALADAMMIGVAGVLLLTPGYFTDLLGIMLLIPPVRTAIYSFLRSRIAVVAPPGMGGGPRRPEPEPGVIDLDEGDWRQR
jgi:UPF0716 protein FxsA